jgi:hypothetical protein
MGTFEPVPGLEAMVARMVAPEVTEIGHQVERAAKRLAPPLKEWVTVADDRVRPTHVAAEGQQVPDNLRFKINSMEWDRKHRGLGEHTWMRAPRDESSRAVANIKNCRCTPRSIPDGIARNIRTGPTVVSATMVRVDVIAEGPWVVEAEWGTVYPGGLRADGTHFMARAAAEVAAQRR